MSSDDKGETPQDLPWLPNYVFFLKECGGSFCWWCSSHAGGPRAVQEGSCDEASSVAASRWAPDLGMEEIRLQVALLILEESPADTVCFFLSFLTIQKLYHLVVSHIYRLIPIIVG